KSKSDLSLPLKSTKDILKALGEKKNNQFLAGFALETENHENNALSKLKNKNADMLVLNSATNKGEGFGGDTNRVIIFDKEGNKTPYPLKSKKEVAADIVDYISQKLEL
ncbi:MAG TPA: phosphopantothenoylcysteine decarboxylase, partial [Bacteroidales bacterium]|nr:phosphopantothenoylcysteine decarboxylase [Bacteroidales bacterium]